MSELPPGYLGADGPIETGPSSALVEAGYRLEVADAPILHHGLGLADLAHVQELLACEVISNQVAVSLTRALLEMSEIPVDQFPYDPAYGDAYNSRERVLEERLGQVAGWLPTGRTRREAGRIAFRIALRSDLLRLHEQVAGFAEGLVERARQHHATIWNDTTYLQPAQPSTFGHYLGGFAEESTRNLERIEAAYRWVNQSPAGVGGVAGTSFPFDRERMARRLGFDGPAVHTRDAMWSVDGLTDSLVAATQSSLTADRLAEDLEIFASPQFGYISVPDSASRASVFLPQKRNPYALAVIRGGAGTLIGRTTGVLATQRTPSARTDNWLYAYGETVGAVQLAVRLLALATDVTRNMTIHTDILTASAGAHLSIAADLAERLVVRSGIDYRTAYKIVGNAVTSAKGGQLTAADLSAAANLLGLGLEKETSNDLLAVANPADIVAGRHNLGGSAPARVLEHCQSVGTAVEAHRAWARDRESRISGAEEALVEAAQELARQKTTGT